MSFGKRSHIVMLIVVSSAITYTYWSIDWAFWAATERRSVQLPTPVGYWQLDPWVWWGLNYFGMIPLIVLLAWICLIIGGEMKEAESPTGT